MAIEFIDRVSARPGRVKITPEDGSSPFYAVMERADEPTVPGTPMNATNLNLAQQILVYENNTSLHTFKRVYVGPSGSDNNTGNTTSDPMATIKGALRKYGNGHKYIDVYLLDGTYTEDIGTISTDACSLSIRSNSQDKEKVTINMATMLESHIELFRMYNITINLTASGIRPLSVNAGMMYANNVRVNMPTTSGSSCVNVYNGASAFFTECIFNAGTGAAVYGNQALHIKAYNCTSERTLTRGFYANNGTNIEYTPTLTATEMVYETNGGKCVELAARPGSVAGTIAYPSGQYMTYDGLLIQWGTVNITPTAANVATGATVTYPIPFADSPTAVATPITTVPDTLSIGIMRSGEFVSDSKLQLGIMLVRSSTTSTGINWVAFGKGSL